MLSPVFISRKKVAKRTWCFSAASIFIYTLQLLQSHIYIRLGMHQAFLLLTTVLLHWSTWWFSQQDAEYLNQTEAIHIYTKQHLYLIFSKR